MPNLVDAWRFEYEGLAGYIAGGSAHGVELTAGAGSRPVTRAKCLNLEHYYSLSCPEGRMVPRMSAAKTWSRIAEDAARLVIQPYGDWRVRSAITYRLMPERIIEAEFEFAFETDFASFEAFISDYFHQPTEPFIHINGQWVQPSIAEDEHRFWARDDQAAATIPPLYGERIAGDVRMPVDPVRYDYPVMITPVGDSTWSVVNITQKPVCSSLSANRKWNAHDFSLLGHDVKAGEVLTCKAWIAYVKLDALDDALELYRTLCGRAG